MDAGRWRGTRVPVRCQRVTCSSAGRSLASASPYRGLGVNRLAGPSMVRVGSVLNVRCWDMIGWVEIVYRDRLLCRFPRVSLLIVDHCPLMALDSGRCPVRQDGGCLGSPCSLEEESMSLLTILIGVVLAIVILWSVNTYLPHPLCLI